MNYLNVATIGLRGRHHPALSNQITTRDVKLARPHLKFLAGNYLTYQIKANQSGGSPRCRICTSGAEESISHVISVCSGMSTERERIMTEFRCLAAKAKNNINFDEIISDPEQLCQFILDPTSLNLSIRLSLSDPLLKEFFQLSRDFCYIIDKTRIQLLKELEKTST